MGAIFEALAVGVRVTWWLFSRVIYGYRDVYLWWDARNRGEYYGFPTLSFLLAVILTVFLLSFCMMMQTAPR